MSLQPQERGLPTLTGGLLESEAELHELSADFIFLCPGFQHDGLLVTSLALGFLRFYQGSFPQVGFLLCLASSLLGPCRRCFNQVKPESWHHRCQVSVIPLVLSHHNKDLKRRMLKPSACHSSWTVHVIVLGQISFTQKIKENISLRGEDMRIQKTRREERGRDREYACSGEGETPGPLAPLFICFFPLPGPALCKLGQPGVLFVLPEVLTPVLGHSFVLFSRALPFLVFQPPPFWTPFSHSNHLTGCI